jgi:uncharacterized protein (DUF885 family)
LKRPSGLPSNPRRRLRDVFGKWLDGTCELFPEQATKLGLRAFDGQLSANTPETHRRHIRLLEETLADLEALPPDALEGDDLLDRRVLLAKVRMDLMGSRDLVRWRNDPQMAAGAAIDSIFDLLIRSPDDPARHIEAITSRLRALPDHLEAAAGCVKRPDPLWSSLAQRSCEGAATFLEGLEKELAPRTKDPAGTLRLLRHGALAFRDHGAALARRQPARHGSFAIGRERFEFLVRENLGLDLSLGEVRAIGLREVARHEALLAKEARRHGARSARDLLERAAEAWDPGGPLVETYRARTAAIAARLRRNGFVGMPPDGSLRIMNVPPFLRHQFPTAAYSGPEPLGPVKKGIFWINDLGHDAADEKSRRAEIRQHFGLDLTCVHEAWPGHHLQFLVQSRHPSRIRRLAAHPIFYEGWTMWCEMQAVASGLVDFPFARTVQLQDALWRAYRIVIDCGLHDGSLSHRAAATMLREGVGFTRARAEADVNWYTSSPTVPASYLLGRLEVERLHRRLVSQGGWTTRRFNDWMLSFGAVPYSWIEATATA